MLKSPTTVLTSFITAITEEKELKFSMEHWFEVNGEDESKPKAVGNVCGTSACIAGTVAFRMDPESDRSCTALILDDIGVQMDPEWDCAADDASDEDIAVDESLDHIFTSSLLYDHTEGLANITQDEVLVVLRKLVEGNYTTWVALLAEINSIRETNV